MSNRYKGGVISATPPTTTGGDTGTASGAWTLEQQMQLQAAGLWPSQPPPLFIEDVFSTYLHTGNGSTQTITNGINLSGKGGMVWFKNRSNAFPGNIFDTVRNNGYLTTTTTGAVNAAGGGVPPSSGIASFNSNGFTIADGSAYWNSNSQTYVSWTFREQAKFFDVVTWTGNGSYPRTINHNLGSTPGCIIIKSVSDAGYGWMTWHRSLGANDALQLQTTGAAVTDANFWNGTPTSTTFSVGSYSGCNANGVTYVAYLFAHNAGGFGLTETDNVISCGGGTYDINGYAVVNLGYEPQWVLIKSTTYADNWYLADTMRGTTALITSGTNTTQLLYPNLNNAEATTSYGVTPDATGFTYLNGSNGQGYIYIAIRRGPMKVPTVGTSVFDVETFTGSASAVTLTTGFPSDAILSKWRTPSGERDGLSARLIGSYYLRPSQTVAENSGSPNFTNSFAQTGVQWPGGDIGYNETSGTYVNYFFRRAPSFFDEVCYTGTEVSGQTFNHNLGAVPEMMIVKARDGTTDWTVYHSALGASARIYLNATNAANTGTAAPWNSTTPTSTVFSLGNAGATNLSGTKFVNYLFATCAGVSKVGSYTGTGALQTVNCGFAAGARFVLIKRTDSTGDWFVWDSARGITSGNDPYLLLNTTAAEVTGTNYVDTTAVGFQVTAAAPAAINANGGTFIFLAIA